MTQLAGGKHVMCLLFFLDVSIGDKKLSAILGELIWEEMSRCIIHECLVHSIPNNSSQLEKYSTVRPYQCFHYISTVLYSVIRF